MEATVKEQELDQLLRFEQIKELSSDEENPRGTAPLTKKRQSVARSIANPSKIHTPMRIHSLLQLTPRRDRPPFLPNRRRGSLRCSRRRRRSVGRGRTRVRRTY
jgi:hypothetical protein